MYTDRYSKELTKKLNKLKKKNLEYYQTVRKKVDWILKNPEHKYKILHHDMKGLKRIHMGSFVLTFKIDNINKIIYFADYDHHDKIYQK